MSKTKCKCIRCDKMIITRSKKFCSHTCHGLYMIEEKISKWWIDGKWNVKCIKSLKKALIEKHGHKCSKCNRKTWNGEPISLEFEHKDGNFENNHPDNVCLLCPNCHSQTSTYKGRNKGNGRPYRREKYIQDKLNGKS